MQPSDLVNQYLGQQHMMQLATLAGDQPWCCTVYYFHDKVRNIYWASLPTRRHSQEIAEHNKVAAAIAIKFVKGQPVVGIQLSGSAEQLQPSEAILPLAQQYAEKFGRDAAWVNDFVAGTTGHRLYKLTLAELYLFDEVNFPGGERQQILPV
jgi:uncharacterized protein YhbP (UPF0306 family)